MNVKTLNELSLLDTALSVEYCNYLELAAASSVNKEAIRSVQNIYSAYCYLVGQGNYTAFEILSDSNSINAHVQSVIGFIYNCDGITAKRKYTLCNQLKRLFRYIAQDKQFKL